MPDTFKNANKPEVVDTAAPLYLALVGILCFAGASLGQLSAVAEGITIFWPANGVALAALVRFGAARLGLLGLVVVAANAAALWPGYTLAEGVLFGLINFAEALLAWRLLVRLRFDPAFAALPDVGKFALAGPGAAAFLAALLAAAVHAEFRGVSLGFFEFVRLWWFSDALGLLIFTPVFLGFPPFRAPGVRVYRPDRNDALLWAAGALVLIAMWLLAGIQLYLGPLLLFVFVLLAAARLPPHWAALAVAGGAALIVAVVITGRSQFGEVLAPNEVTQAQQVMMVMSLMGLAFSTMLWQLRERQAALLALNAELEKRVAERTAELERLASVDALTGLSNRRTFDERLAAETKRVARYGGRLALVLVDIDHFKDVNDTHGHVTGDEVIRAFADRLRGGARETDIVARYGGEEFAVLLPETSLEQALVYAERVRRGLVGQAIAPLDQPISASFGVAELGASRDAVRLVAAADAGLYEAKRAGRNRVLAGPLDV